MSRLIESRTEDDVNTTCRVEVTLSGQEVAAPWPEDSRVLELEETEFVPSDRDVLDVLPDRVLFPLGPPPCSLPELKQYPVQGPLLAPGDADQNYDALEVVTSALVLAGTRSRGYMCRFGLHQQRSWTYGAAALRGRDL